MNKKLTIFSLLVFAIAGSLLAQTRPEHVAIGDIYCSNGDIVTPDTYGSRTDGIGVVFYVDETMLRGWIAYCKHSEALAWYNGSSSAEFPGLAYYQTIRYGNSSDPATEWLIKDVNGEKNTDDVENFDENFGDFPAFAYVRTLGSGWYLPAAGQLNFMFAYIPVLNNSLQKLIESGVECNPFFTTSWDGFDNDYSGYWTSDVYGKKNARKLTNAWYICGNPPSLSNVQFAGGFYSAHVTTTMRVRAVRSFNLTETE